MGKFNAKSSKIKLDGCPRDHAVRCSLCNEILICSTEDTASLVEHLRTKHPNTEVARFPPIKRNKEENEGPVKRRKQLGNEDTKVEATSKNKEMRTMYETTVEVWELSSSPIKCEICGVCATPVVRRRKNSKTQSTTRALCLLGCWPFCFLPHMMSGDGPENVSSLYCSKCGHLLTDTS